MKEELSKILRKALLSEANQSSTNRVVKLLNSLEFKNDILAAGGEIYAVGGIVRDAIMGKQSDDLDIVVRGVPYDKLYKILTKYGKATDTSNLNKEDKDFGATKFVSLNPKFNELLDKNNIRHEIDVMLPRKDAKDPNVRGHKGIKSDVNPSYTIQDDLERRDITINAIALGLDGSIIDKDGRGQQDIKNGVIRAVSEDSFIEDPLRMLRAIRFGSRFNYKMDPGTLNLIKQNAQLLADKKELPAERFLMEFKKMIGKADLGRAVKQLVDLGMYKPIFGVDSKISDFSIFNKADNLGEFAFMLFDGQPLATVKDLVSRNISNEIVILKYVEALVRYIHEVKYKNLKGGELVKAIANLFKLSPYMLSQSSYVEPNHRELASKMYHGEIPANESDIAFKGEEFQNFIIDAVKEKKGSFTNKDGRLMGIAKNLALEAIWNNLISNNANEIKQYLIDNQGKWLI